MISTLKKYSIYQIHALANALIRRNEIKSYRFINSTKKLKLNYADYHLELQSESYRYYLRFKNGLISNFKTTLNGYKIHHLIFDQNLNKNFSIYDYVDFVHMHSLHVSSCSIGNFTNKLLLNKQEI